jgi:hypothetical protein
MVDDKDISPSASALQSLVTEADKNFDTKNE